MNSVLTSVSRLVVGCALWELLVLQTAWAQGPLYHNRIPPTRFPADADQSVIVLPDAASTVADADARFDARAAAAINQGSGPSLSGLRGADYGVALLARYAYADYIDEALGRGSLNRALASATLATQRPGLIGSVEGGDYDMLLNLYVTLIYKYYNVLEPAVREHVINDLLTVRGPLGTHESECENCSSVATIPETENHLFMIETARYLTNQLLYQRTHRPEFDNRRNGHDNDPQATAVWLLDQLRGRLLHDFDEYNARPYQDLIMMAMLNLADFAYDDDVRLAARMVLDYISAKVAVSSNDLRRATPFRRRNETDRWGPRIPDGSALRSPLLGPRTYADDPFPNQAYVPDPQGPWYAQLIGNTALLDRTVPGTPGPGNFGFAMVIAGIHDYRVPDPIVALFVDKAGRRLYQRLHHQHTNRDAGDVEFADEVYAGSPSYLITAGGHPTNRVYSGHVGLIFSGHTSDLGGAMPTTFMPSGVGTTLESLIQFGSYTDAITDNDEVKTHMCVAPDFACGTHVFPTAALTNAAATDPTIVKEGPWTFVDRGHDGQQQSGYYLALYDGFVLGDFFGLLEAYDTWLHPGLSFQRFKVNVLAAHGATRFLATGTNTYVTQSGQRIEFTIAPLSAIVSSSTIVAQSDDFASGDVINSAQGSGVITIANPARPGQAITLDMRDRFHPSRTSESGNVDRAGFDVHAEVWVDFNSPVPSDPNADFYRPLKTLAAAQQLVLPGGTIKIVPGSTQETLRLEKKMTLTSFSGSAVIGSR